MNHFDQQVRNLKQEEGDLLLTKHRDYGPGNIANAPGGPLNGLAVRLHDKVARLGHLLDTGANPEHEALEDTALDIANYGTIMGLVLSGQWPGTEVEGQPTLDLDDDLVGPASFTIREPVMPDLPSEVARTIRRAMPAGASHHEQAVFVAEAILDQYAVTPR